MDGGTSERSGASVPGITSRDESRPCSAGKGSDDDRSSGSRGPVPVIRLLMVDDDEDFRLLGKMFLEMPGTVEVDTVPSGVVAVGRLRSEAYDGILSDYTMDPMDGLALLGLVRADHPDLPFIILTAELSNDLSLRASECGADFCVRKTGDPKELFALVETLFRSAIGLRRSRRVPERQRDPGTAPPGSPGASGDGHALFTVMPRGLLYRPFAGGPYFYIMKKAGRGRP